MPSALLDYPCRVCGTPCRTRRTHIKAGRFPRCRPCFLKQQAEEVVAKQLQKRPWEFSTEKREDQAKYYPTASWWLDGDFYEQAKVEYAARLRFLSKQTAKTLNWSE